MKRPRTKKYSPEELLLVNSPDYLFTCTQCGISKPNREYYHRADVQGRKYFSACGTCISKRKTPEIKAKYKLAKIAKEFGLSRSAYQSLLIQQNYCCAICGRAEEQLSRKLAVDHCHVDLGVRGLLCSNCNTSLGLLNDSPVLLRKAADYIENYSKSIKISKTR